MSLGLCCLALLQVSCADEPSCVPGQSISCACVQGTQGAQVCAPSGRQYLPCVCLSDVAQLGEPSATRATFEGRTPASLSALESPSPAVSELKASALNSAHSSSAAPLKRSSSVALVSDDPLKVEDETIELAPIELSRATVKAPKNPQMSRQWWLALEREKRCDLKDDINSEHHPAQLLAQGCYIRVRQGAQMKIKCDAAPFGPHTFQYSEREEDCLALMRSQAREQSSDVLRDEAPQSAHASARPKRRDPREVKASEPEGRDWYCMCYQELFQGQASDSTACRRDLESCRDLEQKVLEGSPVLVKNSMSVACKRYQAQEPWDRFGVRYQWLPSSQPGAWWTPRGCFLNPQAAQRRRAQLGAQLKSRAHSHSLNALT